MQPEAFADLVALCIKQAMAPVLTKVSVLETEMTNFKGEIHLATGGVLNDLVECKDTNLALTERLARLEGREPMPGPPGPPGPPGADGKDGTPGLRFAGVYVEGKTYDLGDLVTWGGSSWHCNETTTSKPGEGAKAWTLMVKRGRDGKDGRS